jgi:carboxypeptidase Taq
MQRAAELADLESAGGLLGWDQETKMPRKGVAGRSMVASTLAGVIHEKLTDPTLAEDLQVLNRDQDSLEEVQRAQIKEITRLHTRAIRVPKDLVQKLAEHQSKSVAVWADARSRKDFDAFAPHLETMYGLKRQVADAIGYDENPYDALLDEYEPGAKTEDVATILGDVRDFLIPVVQKIVDTGKSGWSKLTAGPFGAELQDGFGRELVSAMGFDMEAGRLDTSNHPFTSGIHSGDTRLTTRYKEDLTVGLFGTLHETGHGLYEQNLPAEHRRTPLGPSTSLGIHESQSRLWENNVGRSRSFWVHFYPRLQEIFPDRLGSASREDFYRAINEVRPSFIRIEADEVTYNLHIILRFELEQELLSGRLKIQDLPEAWNTRFDRYLRVVPPTPDLGVLQDIHWAFGFIGYFATYTLGNLYAAMFYEAARRDIPDLEEQLEKGELIPLRDWLIQNIHRWGRRYSAHELARRVCGKEFSTDDFKSYITAKFGELYGISL